MSGINVEQCDTVDRIADAAIATGATEPRPPQDMGWLYNRSFADLYGHHWEVLTVDEGAMAAALAEGNQVDATE